MNVSWVVADSAILDVSVKFDELKQIGPIWGGWRTWRNCGTDNVICHDFAKARELLDRKFQTLCNFYIPNDLYKTLDRPPGVKLYEGQFNMEVENPDELIAMSLAASRSDLVLLVGFDFTKKPKLSDKLLEHRAQNRRNLISTGARNFPNVQWVLVDHPPNLIDELKDYTNITTDSFASVFELLKG